MKIIVIDPDEQSREILVSRLYDALSQAEYKRVDIVSGDFEVLSSVASGKETPLCGFLGTGCYEHVEQSIEAFRATFPIMPISLVVDNDIYAEQGVSLRRELAIRIIAIADIGQMVGFVLDSELQVGIQSGSKSRGVVTVTQLKGGVGASTVAVGLAACWARHGLSVALIDLDDVNPQVTEWGRVGSSQRRAVAQMLTSAKVEKQRVNDLLHPVEGFDGQLVIVPQPELYQESFHFKADVLEGAPSCSVFLESLIGVLQEEFDVIVIDTGRSWGIATFAVLPLSQHVLLVTDDDGMSVRRTIDNLERLYNASDDPSEFDLSKWGIVLNAHTGRLLSPKDLGAELQELGLFPDSAALYTIPFSEKGRQWGAPGKSFYDAAEPLSKEAIQKVAFSLVAFRHDIEHDVYSKLRKHLHKLLASSFLNA